MTMKNDQRIKEVTRKKNQKHYMAWEWKGQLVSDTDRQVLSEGKGEQGKCNNWNGKENVQYNVELCLECSSNRYHYHKSDRREDLVCRKALNAQNT